MVRLGGIVCAILVKIARFGFVLTYCFKEFNHLSIERRRREIVQAAIEGLFEEGKSEFRPGDIAEILRERNDPMGVWQLRAEFSSLEEDGLIEYDQVKGFWRIRDASKLKGVI